VDTSKEYPQGWLFKAHATAHLVKAHALSRGASEVEAELAGLDEALRIFSDGRADHPTDSGLAFAQDLAYTASMMVRSEL
jgi:hypothetical protein